MGRVTARCQTRARRIGGTSPSIIARTRRDFMKWETPQATDMRFGFEITMYIANR
jgi:coenzyme PQQ precursor peptide PqqA